MTGSFLVRDSGQLVAMQEELIAEARVLQSLLLTQPSLLAGTQQDSKPSKRWLVVAREQAGDGERWTADHLFLDEEAIPTLVIVGQGDAPEQWRAKLGQVLEFAANISDLWPLPMTRFSFLQNCATKGVLPEQILHLYLNVVGDQESYWQRLQTNLLAGRLRLILATGHLAEEQRRTVEFLNRQLSPLEVLAVEIKQFLGDGVVTVTSRVYGQKREADRAFRQPGQVWEQPPFLHRVASQHGPDVAWMVKRVINWAESRQLRCWWGRNEADASFFPFCEHNGEIYWLFSIWASGRVEIPFGLISERGPFAAAAKRQELAERISVITGQVLPPERLHAVVSFPLSVLREGDALQQLLDAFNWYVQVITGVEISEPVSLEDAE